MKIKKFMIGIDPDVDKSGIAWQQGDDIQLYNYTFFELFERLKYYKERTEKPTVYIECGFLNKSNWHTKASSNIAFNAKIGERTGANFETAKKIIEMCEYLEIPFIKIQPTKSKLNATTFKQLTGITTRTNQETRDAFMLIFGR
jgi:hypothetical protein